MKRIHLIVHGRVQGVGFRYFVTCEARALGLAGTVRNRAATPGTNSTPRAMCCAMVAVAPCLE